MNRIKIANKLVKLAEEMLKQTKNDIVKLLVIDEVYNSFYVIEIDSGVLAKICEKEGVDVYGDNDYDIEQAILAHLDEIESEAVRIDYLDFIVRRG